MVTIHRSWETVAELDKALRFHIEHPDRLSEDKVLEEARQILADGREVRPPTPLLQDQLSRLERQIEIATTPVPVVLLSDNLTEVVVYRVGRLGRFDRKPLELRPGTYTVVGTRAGFRDVRHKLRVAAGESETSLTIRCEEEI